MADRTRKNTGLFCIRYISVQNIRFLKVGWGGKGREEREERGERGEGHVFRVFSIWLPGGGNVYSII